MAVEKAKNVPPFVLWCSATIPTAFDDSMSYYEALCALYKWVQDNIINVVNNNADILKEYVKMVDDLKAYVDNYFENLDVQEEINNKLDDMAEGGQLAGIIAQFLEMSPVFAYGTITEMSAAENLSNGSIARVLGNTAASDGDGAYYKVRTKGEGETGDGVNKVEIGATLIADRIQDAAINELQEEIENLTNEEYIILGDSYAVGDTSWANRLITKIGNKAVCHKIALGGLGFAHQSSIGNYTFKTYLENQASTIQHPEKINKIIVCGGYNDNDETFENITAAISSFCEYCKNTYPNAQVYIGMIGYNTAKTTAGAEVRAKLEKITLNAYSYNYAVDYAPVFIEGSNEILKNSDFTGADDIHPSDLGSNAIAKALYAWYLGGKIDVKTNVEAITFNNMSSGSVYYLRTNNSVHLYSLEPLIFTYDTPITVNSGVGGAGYTVIDNYAATKLFPNIENECVLPVNVTVISGDTTHRNLPMRLGLSPDGKVFLYSSIANGESFVSYSNVTYIRIESPIVINLDPQIN